VSTGLFGQCHVQRWWPLTVTLTVMMALAATAASVAQPPPSLLVEERIPLIVLDPGHGGTDQGAQGPTGLLEKDLTLQVATEAGRLIEELLGLRVVLTRTDDSVAPLETRAALANQAGGDLFISICTGGSLAPGRRGFQVFYFDELQGGLPAVREQANNLQRPSPEEQRLRGEDGPPKPVLWDDAQLEFLETSQTFARMLHKNLRAQVGEEGRGVFGLPILLLRWVRTPAVLVDLGSLSDPAFADKLRDEAYLQRAALGIAQAVNDYQALQR
jgi:N-acetylmuramoyl-L-alanine amidase